MRYITLYAKDIPVIPEFFQELESRTRSKVIKQYIHNTIIPFYLDKNKPVIRDIENPSEKVANILEANSIKNLISDILYKKNKVSEHKFIREGNLLSYKMFPTNIFEGLQNTFVKPVVIELKKYLKENSIKLNDTYIKKINKTLQKDKFLRHFVKENYTEHELLTLFIVYKCKTLNVTELNLDDVFTYEFSFEEKERLKHVIDYLNSKLDVENTPNWKEEKAQKEKELKEYLSNLSFEDLTQEVTRYNFTDENIQTKSLQDEIKDKDVKLVYTYPNKYSWVSIISEEGLDREGSNMNHCVGGDDYWRAVRNGETIIYSLRDKYNRPHITIEVTDDNIVQIQGYGNSDISDKYHDMLLDGLQKRIKFKAVPNYCINRIGIVQDSNNTLHSIYNLPDNFEDEDIIIPETNRHFTLKNIKCYDIEIKNCPNINITGKIDTHTISILNSNAFFSIYKFWKNFAYKKARIYNYFVNVSKESELDNLEKCIPDKIQKILKDNNIQIEHLHIKSISMTKVKGNLDLANTPITDLPEKLHVGGSLYLYGTKIKKLPKDLRVGGDLNLDFTDITEIPENLHVNGYLTLRRSKVTKISKGLRVEGDLDLDNTFITELPENLYVGGFLNIYGTNIKELPDGLTVGSLHIDDRITKFPKRLTAKKLDVSSNTIKELPKDLKVNRLDLRGSNVTRIPDTLKELFYLDIRGVNIEYLPEGMKLGVLHSNSSLKLKELPKMYVIYNLILTSSSIEKLPDNLYVGGNLTLYNCYNLKKLPKGLHVGDILDIRYTGITEIPRDIKVGSIRINRSKKDIVPDGINIVPDGISIV